LPGNTAQIEGLPYFKSRGAGYAGNQTIGELDQITAKNVCERYEFLARPFANMRKPFPAQFKKLIIGKVAAHRSA
jgi:hypothetical protein